MFCLSVVLPPASLSTSVGSRAKFEFQRIIRSAALPRPLNPQHVQVLQGDLSVIRDNGAFLCGECRASPVFKLSINKIYDCAPVICSYNQTQLPRLSLAQRRVSCQRIFVRTKRTKQSSEAVSPSICCLYSFAQLIDQVIFIVRWILVICVSHLKVVKCTSQNQL